MKLEERPSCKRPYSLGRRQGLSDDRRQRILAVARQRLESDGFLHLTLNALARESGVTRQTIYNLFGTRAGLFEALFDQLAVDGGMGLMREVMQQAEADSMLESFVTVFTRFWKKDRLFIRRIHGIAAIDAELGAAVEARNQRRRAAATRVIDRLGVWATDVDARNEKIAVLWAMTSFEFFDALASSCGAVDQAADLVWSMVKRELER